MVSSTEISQIPQIQVERHFPYVSRVENSRNQVGGYVNWEVACLPHYLSKYFDLQNTLSILIVDSNVNENDIKSDNIPAFGTVELPLANFDLSQIAQGVFDVIDPENQVIGYISMAIWITPTNLGFELDNPYSIPSSNSSMIHIPQHKLLDEFSSIRSNSSKFSHYQSQLGSDISYFTSKKNFDGNLPHTDSEKLKGSPQSPSNSNGINHGSLLNMVDYNESKAKNNPTKKSGFFSMLGDPATFAPISANLPYETTHKPRTETLLNQSYPQNFQSRIEAGFDQNSQRPHGYSPLPRYQLRTDQNSNMGNRANIPSTNHPSAKLVPPHQPQNLQPSGKIDQKTKINLLNVYKQTQLLLQALSSAPHQKFRKPRKKKIEYISESETSLSSDVRDYDTISCSSLSDEEEARYSNFIGSNIALESTGKDFDSGLIKASRAHSRSQNGKKSFNSTLKSPSPAPSRQYPKSKTTLNRSKLDSSSKRAKKLPSSSKDLGMHSKKSVQKNRKVAAKSPKLKVKTKVLKPKITITHSRNSTTSASESMKKSPKMLNSKRKATSPRFVEDQHTDKSETEIMKSSATNDHAIAIQEGSLNDELNTSVKVPKSPRKTQLMSDTEPVTEDPNHSETNESIPDNFINWSQHISPSCNLVEIYSVFYGIEFASLSSSPPIPPIFAKLELEIPRCKCLDLNNSSSNSNLSKAQIEQISKKLFSSKDVYFCSKCNSIVPPPSYQNPLLLESPFLHFNHKKHSSFPKNSSTKYFPLLEYAKLALPVSPMFLSTLKDSFFTLSLNFSNILKRHFSNLFSSTSSTRSQDFKSDSSTLASLDIPMWGLFQHLNSFSLPDIGSDIPPFPIWHGPMTFPKTSSTGSSISQVSSTKGNLPKIYMALVAGSPESMNTWMDQFIAARFLQRLSRKYLSIPKALRPRIKAKPKQPTEPVHSTLVDSPKVGHNNNDAPSLMGTLRNDQTTIGALDSPPSTFKLNDIDTHSVNERQALSNQNENEIENEIPSPYPDHLGTFDGRPQYSSSTDSIISQDVVPDSISESHYNDEVYHISNTSMPKIQSDFHQDHLQNISSFDIQTKEHAITSKNNEQQAIESLPAKWILFTLKLEKVLNLKYIRADMATYEMAPPNTFVLWRIATPKEVHPLLTALSHLDNTISMEKLIMISRELAHSSIDVYPILVSPIILRSCAPEFNYEFNIEFNYNKPNFWNRFLQSQFELTIWHVCPGTVRNCMLLGYTTIDISPLFRPEVNIIDGWFSFRNWTLTHSRLNHIQTLVDNFSNSEYNFDPTEETLCASNISKSNNIDLEDSVNDESVSNLSFLKKPLTPFKSCDTIRNYCDFSTPPTTTTTREPVGVARISLFSDPPLHDIVPPEYIRSYSVRKKILIHQNRISQSQSQSFDPSIETQSVSLPFENKIHDDDISFSMIDTWLDQCTTHILNLEKINTTQDPNSVVHSSDPFASDSAQTNFNNGKRAENGENTNGFRYYNTHPVRPRLVEVSSSREPSLRSKKRDGENDFPKIHLGVEEKSPHLPLHPVLSKLESFPRNSTRESTPVNIKRKSKIDDIPKLDHSLELSFTPKLPTFDSPFLSDSLKLSVPSPTPPRRVSPQLSLNNLNTPHRPLRGPPDPTTSPIFVSSKKQMYSESKPIIASKSYSEIQNNFDYSLSTSLLDSNTQHRLLKKRQ